MSAEDTDTPACATTTSSVQPTSPVTSRRRTSSQPSPARKSSPPAHRAQRPAPSALAAPARPAVPHSPPAAQAQPARATSSRQRRPPPQPRPQVWPAPARPAQHPATRQAFPFRARTAHHGRPHGGPRPAGQLGRSCLPTRPAPQGQASASSRGARAARFVPDGCRQATRRTGSGALPHRARGRCGPALASRCRPGTRTLSQERAGRRWPAPRHHAARIPSASACSKPARLPTPKYSARAVPPEVNETTA